jgi:hypothetical protein
MKTTLLVISAATLALWSGYTIGYRSGYQNSYAKYPPRYSAEKVTALLMPSMNSAPGFVASTIIHYNVLVPRANTLVIGGH